MSVQRDLSEAQFVQDDRSTVAIVFTGEGKLNPWHCERWGLFAMRRLGVDVLYFDAQAARSRAAEPRGFEEGILAFADERRLCEHLQGHYTRFLVLSPFHLDQGRFRYLAKFLAAHRMPWCLFDTVPIPTTEAPTSAGLNEWLRHASFQARRVLRRDGVVGGVRFALERARSSGKKAFGPFWRRYDPQYALLAGTACDATIADLHVKCIKAHSQDYESARERGLLAPVAARDYCVFVDQNEPAHSDWDVQGVPPSERIDARWYYDALLNSLGVIERETKLQVVILPHPRSAHEPGTFGPYKMLSGDTLAAIAAARLVVGHYSTALGFAALFKKPLVLLNAALFRRIVAGRIDRVIGNFAAQLGSPILSMDHPSPAVLANWSSIDSMRYERYVARYLKYPGSADVPLWTGAVSYVMRDQGWLAPGSQDSQGYSVMPMSARPAEHATGGSNAF